MDIDHVFVESIIFNLDVACEPINIENNTLMEKVIKADFLWGDGLCILSTLQVS